jgi:hypothetical protein
MVLQGFCAHLQRLMDIMRQVSVRNPEHRQLLQGATSLNNDDDID